MLTIKKQGKIAAILILAATFLTACGPPGPRALSQGQQLLSAGKTTEAIEKFDHAVQLLGPDSPQAQAQAYNWLGLAYHQAGQIDKAAAAYKESLQLDRNLSAAAYNLGCLEFDRGNYRDAVDELNKSLALARPAEIKESDIYLKLGNSYVRLAGMASTTGDRNRDYDAGKRCFDQANKLAPSAEAYNGLGIIFLYRQRSPNDAVAHFSEAKRLQPSFAAAWLNLAVLHQFYLNDRKQAAMEYRNYLQCLPSASNAREVEAQIRDLERESNPVAPPSKPVAVVQPTPKPEPTPQEPAIGAVKEPPARYRYAGPFTPTLGNRQEATHLLAEGIKAQQDKKLNEAVEIFQRSIKADPTYFDAYYYLGAAARETGNMAASLEALEKAVALRPDSTETRYGFAWALQKGRFPQDSANELEKLVKLSPSDTRAHLFLANLYAQELNQPKLARLHYTQVLSAEPNHAQAGAIRHWLSANP